MSFSESEVVFSEPSPSVESYLMKNDDNEHWWLVEDGNGQVGYVPAAYLMIIVDETHQEEENDTDRRDGHERRADGTKIGGEMGQDGERRSIQQQ